MGRLGALWGRIGWSPLGPSWGPLGGLLGRHGGLLGRLGRYSDQRSEYAESIRFPKGMGQFLPLGGSLGGLVERLEL